MQELAHTLGVSVSTVSLALRDKPVVALSTRERVQREARRLGYVYNRSAANLRQQKRTLVGLIVPDITNPFVSEMALSLQSTLSDQGQFVVLANTKESIAAQESIVNSLIEERAAGVVLIPAIGTEAKHLRALVDSKVPAVLVNREVGECELPFIGSDDDKIVALALDHLVNVHKITEIAYFGGLAAASPRSHRVAAFHRRLESLGVREAKAWNVATDPNPESAREAASRLLESEPLPRAILCHSDSIAIGLLSAIDGAGLSMASCSVVAIDAIATGALTTPPLTTIDVGTKRMAEQAGSILLAPAQPGLRRVQELEPRLVVRRSCGCPG